MEWPVGHRWTIRRRSTGGGGKNSAGVGLARGGTRSLHSKGGELKIIKQRGGCQPNREEGRHETWGPLGNWLWWQLRAYKSLGMSEEGSVSDWKISLAAMLRMGVGKGRYPKP